MNKIGWIGVDLDGTLAYYTSWKEQGNNIGKPIQPMVDRVRSWIEDGWEVRIFTARQNQIELIDRWCLDVGLPLLKVTNVKDPYMAVLFDDRCVQVEKNTGKLIGEGIIPILVMDKG